MVIVAERLTAIALAEPVSERADLYGRSAFNRYYYATYLITRDMLLLLNPPWKGTPHSKIPDLLTEAVITKIRKELLRQQKSGVLRSGRSKSMLNEANAAAAGLSHLLKNAYEIRCVADYEPDEKILCDGQVIKLRDHTFVVLP